MPELPEVETMCRGIQPIVGCRIAAVERTPSPCQPIRIQPGISVLNRRLIGQTIHKVERAGKRVVLRIGADECLVFEPRMTGLVLMEDPPTREHLRFRIRFAGRRVRPLLFWDRRGLGQIHLVDANEFKRRILEGKLGPDALAISSDEMYARLRSRKSAIKVALLNQKLVAGIGNLYASEMLFLAGIHPARRCDRLSHREVNRLHQAMIRVLKAAIRYEGSTLSDGTYRNAFNQAGGYQNHHRVYDRAGSDCFGCQGPIQRIVQAQRATFFCPCCQARRG